MAKENLELLKYRNGQIIRPPLIKFLSNFLGVRNIYFFAKQNVPLFNYFFTFEKKYYY